MTWTGYRPFTLDRKVQESESAASFYLVPADGEPLAPFRAGQHIQLRAKPAGQELPVLRMYTLSDRDHGESYRISVKKEPPPPGREDLPPGAMSAYLHDEFQVGDTVEIKAPGGDFCLDLNSDEPAVLIAGGIGVTPMIGMLTEVAHSQPEREIDFFYALRGRADHAFQEAIDRFNDACPNLSTTVLYEKPSPDDLAGRDYDEEGRLNPALLSPLADDPARHYFICGPQPMMDAVITMLTGLGVDEERIRTESFGSQIKADTTAAPPADSSATAETPVELTVTFTKSNLTVPWDDAFPSLYHLADHHDVEIDVSCLFGDCTTCETRVVKGEVAYNHETSAKPGPGFCLPCSCKPAGPVELEA